MKTRIHFLDNLRTFMILLVVVLHAAIGYTPFLENVWVVNDPAKSSIMGYTVIYIDIFVMFIMFFISGYFVPQSYNKRDLYRFIAAKFRRIMIPWIVAVFTLIPFYKVLFLYSRGLPQEEWYTYFHFFARSGGNMGFYADNPAQSWLWFLPVLFMFQVVYAFIAKAGVLKIKISLKTAVILTFFTGLIYSLTIASMGLNGWFSSPVLHFQRERLLVYFLFFLLGSLCHKLKAFDSSKNNYVLHLISYAVLVISIYTFTTLSDNYFANLNAPGRDVYIVSEAADGIMYYSAMLLIVFSSLYVFIKIFRIALNKNSFILDELSANSYQVYIVHMIIIGLISIPMMQASVPAIVKFISVTILAYIICNLLVSAYRHTLQEILSRNIVVYASISAIALVTVIACGQISNGNHNEKVMQNDIAKVPEISLHMAAIYGDTSAIRQHIRAGTNIDEKEPSAGSSPLISASLFGKTEAVKILIEAGADVNYQNYDGSTALHSAAFFCRPGIVKMLLANGADRNIKNNSGSTAVESVLAPWKLVKGIYDHFGNTLGPLGLEIDYNYLKETRTEVAEILKN